METRGRGDQFGVPVDAFAHQPFRLIAGRRNQSRVQEARDHQPGVVAVLGASGPEDVAGPADL